MWLFSEPALLATVTVDDNGEFSSDLLWWVLGLFLVVFFVVLFFLIARRRRQNEAYLGCPLRVR